MCGPTSIKSREFVRNASDLAPPQTDRNSGIGSPEMCVLIIPPGDSEVRVSVRTTGRRVLVGKHSHSITSTEQQPCSIWGDYLSSLIEHVALEGMHTKL